MRKPFLLLLCLYFTVAVSLQALAQQPSAVIKKATVAPVIDGEIDAEWATANVYNIDRPFVGETPTLGAPGETTWQGLWTDEGIYILLKVTDNVFSPSFAGNPTEMLWMFDKPEIYFDVNSVKMDGRGAGTDGNGSGSGHYQFAPDFIAGQISGGIASTVNSNGAVYSFNVSDPTYIAEYFIPFAKLVAENGMEVVQNQPIGFDISIGDNDTRDLIRNRAVWANTGLVDENWNSMDDAGTIILEGATAKVYVTTITLTEGSITTDNGSLQMVPIIEPADATSKRIKWSVSPEDYAWISSTGLLTAKKDGQVYVQALAMDGSSVFATTQVTISGQEFQLNDIDLIQNGSFDMEGELSQPWGFYTTTTAQAPAVVNGTVVCTPVVAQYDWQYQFGQENLYALPDQEYILTFKAWATGPRTMTVDFEDEANNYDKYGFSNDPQALFGRSAWAMDLSTTPTTFTFHVTFDQIRDNTIQAIKFFLAAAPEVVYIDDVSLVSAKELTGVQLSVHAANFEADGGNLSLNLTSENAWTATSDQSWLTASPTSGLGTHLFTLAAEANPLMVKRSATVTVSSPSYPGSQTITITQNGQPRPPKTLALTAGGLKNALTPEELAGITQLILTGSIDARDFKTMRDEMPLLAELDLSGATIVSYAGTEGTSHWGNTPYPPNAIPEYAFFNTEGKGKASLTSIVLPESLKVIEENSFHSCNGLTSVTIPPLVKIIHSQSFGFCTNLTSINIPASVTQIGDHAFLGSSVFLQVDESNAYYSSADGVLFNKSKTFLIYFPNTKTGSYIIPSTVESILPNAFQYCNLNTVEISGSVKRIESQSFFNCIKLNTVNIPSSVNFIGTRAFTHSYSLRQITVGSSVPLDLTASDEVFADINISNSTLYVPYGSKAAYQAANQWKDFTNIVEATSGFNLSASTATIRAEEQSTATVSLTANVSWTAACDQSWLSVSPVAGNGNQTLTFTAQANTAIATRTAVVTISAEGVESQSITITQSGIMVLADITPGALSSTFTPQELAVITRLTLTGTIDARDFKTMRDQMLLLAELDISQAIVVAYSGLEGTSIWGHNDYPAHTIPEAAFMNPSWQAKNSLTSVILPTSLLSIGENAFYRCNGLTTLSIPSQVTNIDPDAFSYCYGLTSVAIPASVASIGERAFLQCNGLLNVEAANPNYSSLEGVLFNKNQTVLIQCPISKAGAYVLPSSVLNIGERAFEGCSLLNSVEIPLGVELIDYSAFSNCSGLTSLSIPSSVKTIKSYAFAFNQALTSINVNHSIPLNLNGEGNVFFNINRSNCTLYVPYGAKAAYQASYQWKDFTNIVEAGNGFNLSATTAALEAEEQSTATVSLTANVSWTAASNESWLTVSPASGNDHQTLTFTAQANTSISSRTAVVTVSVEGFDAQTITLTQAGSNAPFSITAGGLSAAFTPEELATITRLTLIGTMDARDFKTLRDEMPLLAELDISGATVVEYIGTEGTSVWEDTEYQANTIPICAFLNADWQGKSSLTSIVFPDSITAIGPLAFFSCNGLTSVSIPPLVETISNQAFSYCNNLSSINLPASVAQIVDNTFMGSPVFLQVDESNANYSSVDGVLFNKSKTSLLYFPNSITGSYIIPSTVESIQSNAFIYNKLNTVEIPNSVKRIESNSFFNCMNLTSVNIPSSVSFIGNEAFAYSQSLNQITVDRSVPLNLSASYGVFNDINKSSCTLYVPYGSKAAYQTANQWKDFTNIIEATSGFVLASNAVTIGSAEGSFASVAVKANVNWQAESNQSWLTVAPVFGSNDGSLTLTASRNSGMTRTAMVTVRSTGNDSQFIYVTQKCPDIISDLNIIRNGNFANDSTFTMPWEFWTGNGGKAPVVVNGVLVSTPIHDVNSIWNYNVSQSNLQALPNTDYVLSFTAWAATNRVISVTFQDINNDFLRYGTTSDPEAEWGNVSQWKLNLTTVPTTYTLHVNFDKMLPNTNQQIAFSLAHSSDVVYIDNVTLVKADDLLLVNSPVANAGQDQIINESTLVTLDGSLSSDPNGDQLTYRWTAPPDITLSSENVARPTFMAPEDIYDHRLTFSLVVNDGTTDSPADQVYIWVKNVVYPRHFTPIWSGNGYDHMNIYVYSAKLDGVDLEAGDEIGIFDGESCVGAGVVVSAPVTIANTLDLVVSRNDGTANGYEPGNAISYKIYDKSQGKEIPNVSAIYNSVDPSWSTDGKFAIGASAYTDLNGVTKVSQDIALTTGWNVISANVVPGSLDMKTIFQPLIDQGTLQKVMDEAGKTIEYFALMSTWRNSIGQLNLSRGYKVKVTAPATLSLEGMPISLPYEMPLNQGWNIISWPSSQQMDAKAVVQSLIDQGKLQKVMDETGKTIEYFALMGTWRNNIGNFNPGKGYKVKVTESCPLMIPAGGVKSAVLVAEVLASEHFKPVFTGNGTDHMNIHLVNLQGSGLEPGDQLGVFDGKHCVGSATIGSAQLTEGSISIAASADDGMEDIINGFIPGHRVEIYLYRNGQTYALNFEKKGGNESFEQNASLFATVNAYDLIKAGTDEGNISFKCYPNPFTDEIAVELLNFTQEKITVEIYNMTGQRVKSLYKGENSKHMVLRWNGTNDAGQRVIPGIYLCKVNGQTSQIILK